MSLQERIQKYLETCSPAISGQEGHDHTLPVASVLVNGFALSVDQAYPFMVQWNDKCIPPWSEKEIRHKLNEAKKLGSDRGYGWLLNGSTPKSVPEKYVPQSRPTLDPVTAVEKFLNGHRCEVADLMEASPVRLSDEWKRDGITLIENLFQSGERINYVTEYKLSDEGKKAVPMGFGFTIQRDDLITRWSASPPVSDAGGWMRMNPLDGGGITDGNVSAFRFILLEFDSIPFELQISFFSRLALPIACILTSGGKSVHAWVLSDNLNIEEYRHDVSRLLSILAPYGMDKKNKNPSRLSRLPGSRRIIGATGDGIQRLLYLNPTPIQKGIMA